MIDDWIYAGPDLFQQLNAAQVGVADFAGMDVYALRMQPNWRSCRASVGTIILPKPAINQRRP